MSWNWQWHIPWVDLHSLFTDQIYISTNYMSMLIFQLTDALISQDPTSVHCSVYSAQAQLPRL